MPIRYNERKPLEDSTSKRPSKSANFTFSEPVYTMDDMILSDAQRNALCEVIALIRYESLIFETWGLKRVIKRGTGFKVNLYGPPGVGKTMAAHAIAHELQKPTLEVNYAEIESKYVGETSKNLVALFEKAKERDAILLLDEADALLSRRVSEMRSSADVSVNQTRSVLLRLLDEYRGICLFTTNFISNYDPAFMRRITKHIQFLLPDVTQREKLWRHYLVSELPHNADSRKLAEKFDGISGADIANAVLSAAVHSAYLGVSVVEQSFLESAVEDILQARKKNAGKEITVREITGTGKEGSI